MMSSRLRGKTILITGGSAGIGRATAFEFARSCPDSLKIIITGRRKALLEKVAEEIEQEAGDNVKVLPVVLDISDFKAIAGFVGSLPQGWGDIDVLVNNAGLARGMESAPDIDIGDMNLTFDTNIIGLIHMTQAVLPIMLGKGESGQGDIINLGSIAGQDPYPGGSIYCATKSAIRSFSDSLRRELIATRVRVMQIDPGQVKTEFSIARFRGDKAKADAVYAGGEPLTPDDIAEIIVFAATRRENVVFADSLVFPSHQVRLPDSVFVLIWVSFFPQDSNVQHAATTADFS